MSNNRIDIINERTQQDQLIFREQCLYNVLHHPPPIDGYVYCPPLFDGWGCWNYTRAGERTFIPCPPHLFFKSDALAHRDCDVNGTWRTFPPSNKPWANYSLCTQWTEEQLEEVKEGYGYIYVFIAGYCFSLILLSISLLIFFAFRQLRCERITIHKNLFLSYLFTGIAWIMYFSLVNLRGDVIMENPIWCQALHVIAHYCTACNYAWMFCEGVYLHTIMVNAYRSGKTLLICCIVLGWGTPFILTVIYTGIRASLENHSKNCWVFGDVYQWILFGPVVASVAINICLLINIIRLLLTKLRQIPEASQSKKVARATLILVPLFGLQYLIIPVQPGKDSIFYEFYHYFIALLTSLQGALVSIIYCFCNGEVVAVVRRKWHQHRLMTSYIGTNCTTMTDTYSTVQTSIRDLSTPKTKVASDIVDTALDCVELKSLTKDT